MHPCTRAQLSDSFYGWEVRASAQPTNAPAQTQPHYPMPSREVKSTKPPAQTPPRATRHHNASLTTTPGATPPTPGTYQAPACQYLPRGRLPTWAPAPAPSLLLLVVGIEAATLMQPQWQISSRTTQLAGRVDHCPSRNPFRFRSPDHCAQHNSLPRTDHASTSTQRHPGKLRIPATCLHMSTF